MIALIAIGVLILLVLVLLFALAIVLYERVKMRETRQGISALFSQSPADKLSISIAGYSIDLEGEEIADFLTGLPIHILKKWEVGAKQWLKEQKEQNEDLS